MTIEQAKSELMQIYGALSPDKQRAIDTLVKIEPCEDAISRDELLKAIDTWDKFGCDADTKLVRYQDHYVPYIHYDDVIKCIKGMPPVNPQEPKMGHWIEHEWEEMREKGYYRCSVCNCGYQRWTKGIRKSDVPYIDGKEYTLRNIDHYCPNCGAKMESEDKE